jgi:hypothetical protein
VATLEVLERFLELDRQRLQIVRAFGAFGRQPLRVRREFFLRRLLELGDLPTELVAHRRLLEGDALLEAAQTRVDHAHLSAEQNVPNLIQAFRLLGGGSRGVAGAVSRLGLQSCHVFRHCGPLYAVETGPLT